MSRFFFHSVFFVKELLKSELKCQDLEALRDSYLRSIGNIVLEVCKATTDESQNDVLREWGKRKLQDGLLNHVELMSKMGMETGEVLPFRRFVLNLAYKFR